MAEAVNNSSKTEQSNLTQKKNVSHYWMIGFWILAIILILIIIGKNQSSQTTSLIIFALAIILIFYLILQWLNQQKKIDFHKMIKIIHNKEKLEKNYLNIRPENVWGIPISRDQFGVHFMDIQTTYILNNEGLIIGKTYHDMDWYRGIFNRDLASQHILAKGVQKVEEVKAYDI